MSSDGDNPQVAASGETYRQVVADRDPQQDPGPVIH